MPTTQNLMAIATNKNLRIHERIKMIKESDGIKGISSPEEAIEKCDYYLSHNEIREKIAISGMNKTNTAFNYENRLQELFNLAFQ